MTPDGVGYTGGEILGRLSVRGLDHDPHERLGPRGAHEDAAGLAERSLSRPDGVPQIGGAFEAHLVLGRNVDEHLRERLVEPGETRQRRLRFGDRYVLEAMKAGGFSLGGEQSGHVVMTEHATTGDGVLTALQVLSRMAERQASLAELAAVMTRLPQVLVNVPGVDKSRADDDPVLAAAVAEAEAELGDTGRVLLRPSGTEPLVRVMVEAAEAQEARKVADRLADVVRRQLAL